MTCPECGRTVKKSELEFCPGCGEEMCIDCVGLCDCEDYD
jgi:hypothetical protein